MLSWNFVEVVFGHQMDQQIQRSPSIFTYLLFHDLWLFSYISWPLVVLSMIAYHNFCVHGHNFCTCKIFQFVSMDNIKERDRSLNWCGVSYDEIKSFMWGIHLLTLGWESWQLKDTAERIKAVDAVTAIVEEMMKQGLRSTGSLQSNAVRVHYFVWSFCALGTNSRLPICYSACKDIYLGINMSMRPLGTPWNKFTSSE